MDEWLKIIGALGGLEADPIYCYFSSESKTNARKGKGYGGFYGTSKFTFYH